MAIKYGMSASETYKSYRVNTSREILNCKSHIKYFITNVSIVEATKKSICINPDEVKKQIDSDEFCIEAINGRFSTRVNPQWEAKPNANSDLPNGSVLNRLANCGNALYSPNSEISITIRGKGNPKNISPSIIPTILEYIEGLGVYKDDYLKDNGNPVEYIDLGEDVDTNLSDWERGSKDFMAVVSTTHIGDNYVITHNFNLNLETGQGEVRIEKTKYDNTDIFDLRQVIETLKAQ